MPATSPSTPPPPAASTPASTPPYVALGDSYAAGVGGGAQRNPCWRAVEGYPVLVARSLGLDLAYQACLGAMISNVERDQLDALGPGTTHVSLTVGGNDIGFTPVLIEAAKPSWMADSDPVLDDALAILRTELPQRLAALLATIRTRAPQARVAVTAYPVLFNGEDCNALTFFSPHEMRRIKDGVDELAKVIRDVTQEADLGFVDPRAAFTVMRSATVWSGSTVRRGRSRAPSTPTPWGMPPTRDSSRKASAGAVMRCAPRVRCASWRGRPGAVTPRPSACPTCCRRRASTVPVGTASTRTGWLLSCAARAMRSSTSWNAASESGWENETALNRRAVQRWTAACVRLRSSGGAAATVRPP